MSLRSHCSAKLYVFHSFNVSFYMSPHSSLFPLNYLQHSILLSGSRNLTIFKLDSVSCSQEHSVLSYFCDLNYFYEHILKVLSPVHLFFGAKLQLCARGNTDIELLWIHSLDGLERHRRLQREWDRGHNTGTGAVLTVRLDLCQYFSNTSICPSAQCTEHFRINFCNAQCCLVTLSHNHPNWNWSGKHTVKRSRNRWGR